MLSLEKDWNLGKEDCGACPNSCQSLLLTSSGVSTSENGLLEASDLSLLSLAALLNLFPCNAILWMTLRAVVLFDVSKASSWLSLYRAKNFKKLHIKKPSHPALVFEFALLEQCQICICVIKILYLPCGSESRFNQITAKFSTMDCKSLTEKKLLHTQKLYHGFLI